MKLKNYIFIFIALTIFSVSVFATDELLGFQAKVTNSAGTVLTSGGIDITIGTSNSSNCNGNVFNKSFANVISSTGTVDITLGKATTLDLKSDIPYYMCVWTNISGTRELLVNQSIFKAYGNSYDNLTITTDLVINNNLNIVNNLNVTGNANVTGNLNLSGNLNSSLIQCSSLYTSGPVFNSSYGMMLPYNSGYVFNLQNLGTTGLYFDLATGKGRWNYAGSSTINLTMTNGDIELKRDLTIGRKMTQLANSENTIAGSLWLNNSATYVNASTVYLNTITERTTGEDGITTSALEPSCISVDGHGSGTCTAGHIHDLSNLIDLTTSYAKLPKTNVTGDLNVSRQLQATNVTVDNLVYLQPNSSAVVCRPGVIVYSATKFIFCNGTGWFALSGAAL